MKQIYRNLLFILFSLTVILALALVYGFNKQLLASFCGAMTAPLTAVIAGFVLTE